MIQLIIQISIYYYYIPMYYEVGIRKVHGRHEVY